jgi:alkanesulfonate monooxygenase SsuD/methylene tetrahydromethanopterin reductase-like flavin-dependent oxidoreductase (luciferase family)
MPIEFSTTIRCQWEHGESEGIAYSREIIADLPLSFTTLWIEDHLQNDTQALLESWTTLSYIAAQFPRFTYGHLVDCQSYRNPGLLAKMGATMQYLTGGRFIMGVGAGWKEDEYRAYGYDFPTPGARVAQLAETIEILRAMWTQSPATYIGRHYQVEQAYCEPRPDPMIPILVGSGGKKAMEVAARLADAWTWSGPFEERFKPLCEQLWRNCEAVGRDPREITIWSEQGVEFPDDPTTVTQSADPKDAHTLGPTPADAIAQLRPYVEFGVSHFIIFADKETLKRFCAEVVPAFA